MPHFAAVKDQDRLNTLELVRATLTAKFASKGLVHEDVAWRNIGVYKDGGVTKAVVFDLNRVRTQNKTDDSWVDTAMAKLSASA
jgi:hypothetical protein